jgi:transglutaminase-like putative cysteine protease
MAVTQAMPSASEYCPMQKDELDAYLQPSELIDADHPVVVGEAMRVTAGCRTDADKVARLYTRVRDMPYDIFNSFRYLAQGKRRASDVIEAGHAFCMGKASAFVGMCRAVGIPARVGFQQLHCPDKVFMSQEVRDLWRDRPLPWHSLGEAYVNGRWLKLDATIPAKVAAEKGHPYVRDFDAVNDIPSVEGPIVKEIGSFADYPKAVAEWYERVAKATIAAVASADAQAAAANDGFWLGPAAQSVHQQDGSHT